MNLPKVKVCSVGSTSCERYFCIIFCVRFTRANIYAGQFVENLHTQRICANVQRWSKYALLLLASYVEKFGNEKSE